MIYIDSNEPDQIVALIKQSAPISIEPLNQQGMADYYFVGIDGKKHQFNRTQAGELLANIDSFEDELARYYNSAEEISSIIEGVISPYKLTAIRTPKEISLRPNAPPGSLYAYSVSADGYVYGERMYNISNKMYKAWLLGLDKSGITVFNTINYVDTAVSLVAFYGYMQKPEHTTLNRYYKPRITIKDRNPHVQALINLSSAYKLDIGEVKAKAIIDKFECLANVIMAERGELESVAGIGRKTVDHLFDIIGREW